VNRNVLSNQIRQLEQTMGQELFLRDQRNYLRTTLTPAGQELAQEVREALALLQAIP
jgi:DNA-binding transcriptional LysR family regulator